MYSLTNKIKQMNPFRKNQKIRQGKTISWDEFNPELKEYYRKIKQRDMSDDRVKRHFSKIREGNIRDINAKLDNCDRSLLPEIKLTQRYVEQARYTAIKTSQKFKRPTEVSGVGSGRRINNSIYLDQFHIFNDQKCTAVRTQASGFGMIETYMQLKKRKLQPFAQGHSHNTMSTFHSDTDEQLLLQGAEESAMFLEGKIDNITVPLNCFYNVVFNQYTDLQSNERNKPHVRVSYKKPKATLEGKWAFSDDIHIIEPRWKMIKYKEMSEDDMMRLNKEVQERVRYGN